MNLTMNWFNFLKKEDSSSLSDSPEISVGESRKSRKRSLSSSLSNGHSLFNKTQVEKGQGKNVSFDSVTVRNFNLILGDNDGCSVPLSIGWKWVESEPMPVDIYDKIYHQDPNYVCAKKLEPLDLEERKRRLYAVGYSKQHLQREERRRRVQLAMQWAYQTTKTVNDCPNANITIFIERYAS
jgi:hypothetical protein